MRWVEIIRAEEDAIEYRILEWADVRGLWDANSDKTRNISVMGEIIASCPSAWVTAEEYDHGWPGRSGVEYKIETKNPELLRKEIKERVETIIQPPQVNQIASQAQALTQAQAVDGSKDQIIGLLMHWAVGARGVRLPAGYQGMAEANSRNLKAAAKIISEQQYDKTKIKAILVDLEKKLHSDFLRKKIKSIIQNL
jgi:hypothetical protein